MSFSNKNEPVVNVYGLTSDEATLALQARTRARIDQIKVEMGSRYLLHPSNIISIHDNNKIGTGVERIYERLSICHQG